VGNKASLKSCKIAGPVVVAVGGLSLLFITIWSTRQDKLVENAVCEEAVIAAEHFNRTALNTGSNDPQGPIHHFEVKAPSESSWKEMVPPSYEEAVDNNNGIGNSQTSAEVVSCDDDKEASLENTTSAPPSYEERHENATTAS